MAALTRSMFFVVILALCFASVAFGDAGTASFYTNYKRKHTTLNEMHINDSNLFEFQISNYHYYYISLCNVFYLNRHQKRHVSFSDAKFPAKNFFPKKISFMQFCFHFLPLFNKLYIFGNIIIDLHIMALISCNNNLSLRNFFDNILVKSTNMKNISLGIELVSILEDIFCIMLCGFL